MTPKPNEYQEALKALSGITVYEGSPYQAIFKALQAGAEGRILPKHIERGDDRITKIVFWSPRCDTLKEVAALADAIAEKLYKNGKWNEAFGAHKVAQEIERMAGYGE